MIITKWFDFVTFAAVCAKIESLNDIEWKSLYLALSVPKMQLCNHKILLWIRRLHKQTLLLILYLWVIIRLFSVCSKQTKSLCNFLLIMILHIFLQRMILLIIFMNFLKENSAKYHEVNWIPLLLFYQK